MDSRNGIEHKCPCCGYEVIWDWSQPRGNEMVKGDESFIRIKSNTRDISDFNTDKPRHVDWGDSANRTNNITWMSKMSFRFVSN